MPDPEDRIVDTSEPGGLVAFLKRLLILLAGSAVALGSVYLGLSAIGIDDLVEWGGGAGAPPAVDSRFETVEQLLNRLCVPGGPDYLSECRLLRQRLCNQPALEAAMEKLGKRRDHLSSAKLGTAFLDRCDDDERIGLFTAQDYFRLTDFEDALETIDRFPEQVNSFAQFASWRGFILEKLGRFEDAAVDFRRALYLFVDLSKVAAMQFYYVTRSLKAAGLYCDAIVPLQLYVGFDPAQRLSTQIEREISDLRRRGDCERDTAPGRQTVTLARHGDILLVNVEINETDGRFILDTGASTVHMTREFADKAGIPLSEKHRILLRGVTGTRQDYLGKIERVAVGGFTARNVTATIASVEDSLEQGIDGLLGQAFLGRFRYGVDSNRLTLRPLVDNR